MFAQQTAIDFIDQLFGKTCCQHKLRIILSNSAALEIEKFGFLQLARSREAIEPQQSSDFGRARRQQTIIASIRKQALTVDGLSKAPGLMNALNSNFRN